MFIYAEVREIHMVRLRLFGPGKEALASFSAEVEKVKKERDALRALVLDLKENLSNFDYYAKRIELLQNADYHIVARLVVANATWWEIVDDYIAKLELAAKGDREAVREVKDIRSKTPALIATELERLQAKLAKYKPDPQFAKARALKWSDLKTKAWNELQAALPRQSDILSRLPKEKTAESMAHNFELWKSYYTVRVKEFLENDAFEPPARFLWSTKVGHQEKEEKIKRYFELLDMLIQGKDVEEEFHRLEVYMKETVKKEAPLVRQEHPEYFREVGLVSAAA